MVILDASVIDAIGVRDHSESFYYFLLKHSHLEIYNCLLLIKKGNSFVLIIELMYVRIGF